MRRFQISLYVLLIIDARLKQGIMNLGYGLSDVMRLRPVTYKWKEGGDARTHLGLIAQEVEQIIPEAIEKGITQDAPARNELHKPRARPDQSRSGTTGRDRESRHSDQLIFLSDIFLSGSRSVRLPLLLNQLLRRTLLVWAPIRRSEPGADHLASIL